MTASGGRGGAIVTRMPRQLDPTKAPRIARTPLAGTIASPTPRMPDLRMTGGSERARRWAVGLASLQVAVLAIAIAIEPAAASDEVAWEWLGDLLAIGYVAALFAAFSVVPRPRLSIGWSAAAGGLGLALTAGCVLTGHHAVGGWWFGQLALFSVAALAPAWALRTSRTR